MDGSTIGWVGGLLGAVIGLAGGIAGTYASVTRARTPEERRLAVRTALILWLAVGILGLVLALMLARVVPDWVYWAALVAFFVGLGAAVRRLARRESPPR